MPEPRISVIIPAHNEAKAIGLVLAEIPKGLAHEVIVVDNNSTDDTGRIARAGGATVLREPRPGYGYACLAGMAHAFGGDKSEWPDLVVFLDGDHSDFPEQMPELLAPLLRGEADLVIGSRALGVREKGSLLPQQRFGNWLAARLGLRTVEVPVRYRKRIGTSKVSGTVRGTLGAGYKILWTIFKYW